MENTSEHLLVVDDDRALRERLSRYLTEQGFRVTVAEDGPAMDAFLAKQTPDVVILDIMLPGEDGLSLAHRLRANSDIPIIMLSALGDDVDRIIGLEIGADDYLSKPFNPRELLARIRVLLRRRSAASVAAQEKAYIFPPYRLDTGNHSLSKNGVAVSLTAAEFTLLRIFVEHPNRVLSRDLLIDLIKGYDRSPYDRSIDVRVTRLRRKIEENPAMPRYIRTIWGEGYLFSPSGESPE
ncbi:MAG: response regulator [Gammaproteobacteria bacterium]|nr:response regulator [Gammaproteobacteria bacterium]MCW8959378.1 response regulator [Gammaproteobacteria bacterium]MCW8972383.1 response regulator [Gammaproteobacteria bacterium]MCW8992633.1 response regulator [Gammaproteobacteria bacterium]